MRQVQLKENLERMMAALEAEGARLRDRETEIRSYAALSPLRLNDLPTNLLLRAVGLSETASHHNLLLHASCCAKVCSEWRQLVLGDTAYAHTGLPPSERAQVLRDITLQLMVTFRTSETVRQLNLEELGWGAAPRSQGRRVLHAFSADLSSTDVTTDGYLSGDGDGDGDRDGGVPTAAATAAAETRWRVMAAVLQALPVPIDIHAMNLACTGLTAAVAPLLALALARCVFLISFGCFFVTFSPKTGSFWVVLAEKSGHLL